MKALGPEAHARLPPEDVVPTAPMRGLLAYQVGAFAQAIPHGPLSFWVAGSRGPRTQSSPMGHPASVGTVIGIRETVVLLPRCGVGERHPGACLPQAIDEPVPVIGGLHHHALEVGVIRSSWLQNRGQRVG